MKQKALAALMIFAILFVGCNSETAPEKAAPSTAQKTVESSIIRIRASVPMGLSQGTGFVVDYKGKTLIITAAHVSNPSVNVVFLEANGEPIEIKLKGMVTPGMNDVAILLVEGVPASIPRLKLDERKLQPNDKVTAFGYERGGKLGRKEGKVVAAMVLGVGGRIRQYPITTCHCTPGMSGGPLLRDGKVVGVNSAVNRNKENPQTVHVPVAAIRDLLDVLLEEF